MKEIHITAEEITVRAKLNDTLAAKNFEKRLPLTLKAYDNGIEYYSAVAKGIYDPTQTQIGWENGDISLGDGWFSLLYAGEEQSAKYRNMMIIGKIYKKDINLIKKMPKSTKFIISLKK